MGKNGELLGMVHTRDILIYIERLESSPEVDKALYKHTIINNKIYFKDLSILRSWE